MGVHAALLFTGQQIQPVVCCQQLCSLTFASSWRLKASLGGHADAERTATAAADTGDVTGMHGTGMAEPAAPAAQANGDHAVAPGPVADSATSRIKAGDWVVIRGSPSIVDPELVGLIGIVTKLEQDAGVELHVPKLGVSIQLQQSHLSHMPDPPDTLRNARSAATGIDDPLLPRKRLHSEASTSHYLPARIPLLTGRGVIKMKEVVRQIRKEMLTLEENIPWDGVDKNWKVRRPNWRKGIRDISPTTPPVDAPYNSNDPVGAVTGSAAPSTSSTVGSEVALVAGAMLDLHVALRTDKERGLFACKGAWEVKVCELSAGGNNYAALQQVWDEMRDGVNVWLGTEDAVLRGGSPGADGTPGPALVARSAYPPGLPTKVVEKLAYTAVRRAMAALEAAALKGEAYVNQVPLDKILGPSKESFAMIRSLVEQEKAFTQRRIDAAKTVQQAQPSQPLQPSQQMQSPQPSQPSQQQQGPQQMQQAAQQVPQQQPANGPIGLSPLSGPAAAPTVATTSGASVDGTAAGAGAAATTPGAVGSLSDAHAMPVVVTPAAEAATPVAAAEASGTKLDIVSDAAAGAPTTPGDATAGGGATAPMASVSGASELLPLASISSRHVLETLLSPQLKAELQGVQPSMFGEPDSECQGAGDATDMDEE